MRQERPCGTNGLQAGQNWRNSSQELRTAGVLIQRSAPPLGCGKYSKVVDTPVQPLLRGTIFWWPLGAGLSLAFTVSIADYENISHHKKDCACFFTGEAIGRASTLPLKRDGGTIAALPEQIFRPI